MASAFYFYYLIPFLSFLSVFPPFLQALSLSGRMRIDVTSPVYVSASFVNLSPVLFHSLSLLFFCLLILLTPSFPSVHYDTASAAKSHLVSLPRFSAVFLGEIRIFSPLFAGASGGARLVLLPSVPFLSQLLVDFTRPCERLFFFLFPLRQPSA